MSTTIEDRVILLLRTESEENQSLSVKDNFGPLGGHGFWGSLEKITNISAQRWRKAYARRQRPTPDMIEALAKIYPHYAFWLTTGITDAVNGHIAPSAAQVFPERLYAESHLAKEYFQKSLTLTKKLYQEAHVNVDDDKERLYASERTRPLAHWWDSPLCSAAYKIANSQEYLDIENLRKARELERTQLINYVTKPEVRPGARILVKGGSDDFNSTPFIGVDPRTKHQSNWDLFYKSTETQKTRFALSLLNTPPSKLTKEDLKSICALSFSEIEEYFDHHNIDISPVLSFAPGSIRYGKEGLSVDEILRLEKLVNKLKETN